MSGLGDLEHSGNHRNPVLEITAKVEPFENRHGFSLRALRAAKSRKDYDERHALDLLNNAALLHLNKHREDDNERDSVGIQMPPFG